MHVIFLSNILVSLHEELMITYPRGKERRPCKMHTPATEKAGKQMKLHMVPASLIIPGYMNKYDVDKTKNFKHLFFV